MPASLCCKPAQRVLTPLPWRCIPAYAALRKHPTRVCSSTAQPVAASYDAWDSSAAAARICGEKVRWMRVVMMSGLDTSCSTGLTLSWLAGLVRKSKAARPAK
jgi:hypothetical protein